MIKSVYIHIPFCNTICSYCDFCKIYYNTSIVDKYLDTLEVEIKNNYKGEIIDTIYIGGGTPSSLSLNQLKRLFHIIKIFKKNIQEFTIECNIETIDEKKLELFKKNGINRISVGIQSLNDKYIKFLNRNHNKKLVKDKLELLKKYFDNINIDMIYAIPGQSIEELNEDLDFILNLDVQHISTYSLIIEEHTKLYIDNIENIDDELDYEMYRFIIKKLKENNFIHYETSNFSKIGYESKHNLTYWNNEEYYGFGMGSSGYIKDIRYTNTRSINKYLEKKFINEWHKLNEKEIIENEFILGLRKIQGIKKEYFFKKYNIDICSIESVKKMLKEKKILDNGEYIYINKKYLYIANNILIEFIN